MGTRIPSGFKIAPVLESDLPTRPANQDLQLPLLSFRCLQLNTPWCHRTTYCNVFGLLQSLSSPQNVLSAEKSSAAVGSATNLELHKLNTQSKTRTGNRESSTGSPFFFKPEGTRIQNCEQLHSLSKHLIKWGEGKGPLRPNSCKKQLNQGIEPLDLFSAAVLEIKAGDSSREDSSC